MVGLDDQHVGLADAFADVGRGMPEVGEPGEAAPGGEEVILVARVKHEPHRVGGVVRHAEALDGQVAERETRARLEHLPRRPVHSEAGLQCVHGGGVGEYLDVRELLQADDRCGVVAVLVGQEDGVDPVERFTDPGEEFAELAGGKAGIDQYARAFGLEQGRVARAAAAENAKAHGHGRMEGPRRVPPQLKSGSES